MNIPLVSFDIQGVPLRINEFDGAMVLDCSRAGDGPDQDPTGPRFWLERTGDNLSWKLIVHAHGGDPSYCVVIPDATQIPQILDETQSWPE